MKRKGAEPATKSDLWALQKDIQSLRATTQKDIHDLRTATQKDTQGLGAALQAHAEATRKEFQSHARVLKNVAVEVTGLKAAYGELRGDFTAAFSRLESRLIGRMDGFMAKTEKVDRDQFWLIHRMDKIEERVSRIEKRAP